VLRQITANDNAVMPVKSLFRPNYLTPSLVLKQRRSRSFAGYLQAAYQVDFTAGRRCFMLGHVHRDLSFYDKPITKLFAGVMPQPLTGGQIDLFNHNGYLAGIKILDQRHIDALRGELAKLTDPKLANDPLFYEYHSNESTEGDGVLFHALGAWRVSAAFHDLLFHPAITLPASQLLRGRVRFWHDQLFVKPANDGGIVAWHQDYSYWTRTRPVAHLTCWIGLDDSTMENGCVHYVPGSHKWNLLPRGSLADDMNAVIERLTDAQKEAFKPVAIELKAGEASFHHPLMLHGSYANRSSRPRRAAVLNFIRDGVTSDTDEPLLDGVPPIAKGSVIEGRFFPLVDAAV
jgi:ectoine hydroxylase-related dioxygenase (phytanoyl-CoA dioxygenase family)